MQKNMIDRSSGQGAIRPLFTRRSFVITSCGSVLLGLLAFVNPCKAIALSDSVDKIEWEDINKDPDKCLKSSGKSVQFYHKVASLNETSQCMIGIDLGLYGYSILGDSLIAKCKIITSSGCKSSLSPYNSHEKIVSAIIEGYTTSKGLTFQDLEQSDVPTNFYGCYPAVQAISYNPLIGGILTGVEKLFSLFKKRLLAWTLKAAKVIYQLVSKSTDYSFNSTTFSRSFYMGRVDENIQIQQANCWMPKNGEGEWRASFKYTILFEDEYLKSEEQVIVFYRGAAYAPADAQSALFSSIDDDGIEFGFFEIEGKSSDNLLLNLPTEPDESIIREVTTNHIERSEAFVKGYSGIENPTEDDTRILNKYIERLQDLKEFEHSLEGDLNRYGTINDTRSELARIIPEFSE